MSINQNQNATSGAVRKSLLYLNDLRWQPLAERREIAHLILMFKIINDFAAVPE